MPDRLQVPPQILGARQLYFGQGTPALTHLAA